MRFEESLELTLQNVAFYFLGVKNNSPNSGRSRLREVPTIQNQPLPCPALPLERRRAKLQNGHKSYLPGAWNYCPRKVTSHCKAREAYLIEGKRCIATKLP